MNDDEHYNFLGELREEFLDFFEDFIPHHKSPTNKTRQIKIYGVLTAVRPAYAFAERVENALKVVFGISIIVSAVIASVWGFTSLSTLIDTLLQSIVGRIVISIIGISYVVVGSWKLLHIGPNR